MEKSPLCSMKFPPLTLNLQETEKPEMERGVGLDFLTFTSHRAFLPVDLRGHLAYASGSIHHGYRGGEHGKGPPGDAA
jgi:hypothetical protein